MGGGRVEGGEKRNFPWKHFPVYLTIVPPTKASQISPPINSKPARVPCYDLTASQMIQRMQHWAADIYFQFHVDLHPGGLGVLCLRVTGSVLHGESKAVGREQKKNESPEIWCWACSMAQELSYHGKEFNNTPSYFTSLSFMPKSILAQAISYALFPHLRNIWSHIIFYLKGTFH